VRLFYSICKQAAHLRDGDQPRDRFAVLIYGRGKGDALLGNPGREDEAESYFERALVLNLEVAGGKHGMGVVAMRRGNYQRALAWLEEAQ
jgi:hypothetical protein